MSGTIPLSLTQQFDEYGQPLNGGKLYIIQAGTVNTPQDSFQDPSLTIKWPNPITMDAAGRLPQFFLADGFVKIRMTDSAGIVQREADGIQVIGPSGGGGGGGTPVDPNALVQMGNMIFRYGIGSLPGYVRLNGLTMGNAASGASERANADTQALWIYLYGVDSSLTVSGGRTGNALNDYNAAKTIAIPDWRNYALAALGDMGNVDAGRVTAPYFGANPLLLGAAGGAQNHALTAAELALHQHGIALTSGDDAPDHTHVVPNLLRSSGIVLVGGGGSFFSYNILDVTSNGASTRHRHNVVGSTDTGAGVAGNPHSIMPPTKLCTFYIKL